MSWRTTRMLDQNQSGVFLSRLFCEEFEEAELQSDPGLSPDDGSGADRITIEMPIAVYERARRDLVSTLLRSFSDLSPILGQIRSSPTLHKGPIRNLLGPTPLDQGHEPIEQELQFHVDTMREGRIEEIIEILASASIEFTAKQESLFVRLITELTKAADASVDLKGEALSFDHIIDVLSGIELSLDEDGNISQPVLMMHPETIKLFERIRPSRDQQARLQALMLEKQWLFRANKRTRVLGVSK